MNFPAVNSEKSIVITVESSESPIRSFESKNFFPKIGNLNKTLSILSNLQKFNGKQSNANEVAE